MRILWTVGAGIALLATTGCASLDVCQQAEIGAEHAHVSHPTVGRPFGPKTEEDSVNLVGLTGRCESGRVWTEVGMGYKFLDGGFYGPDLVSTLRVGVRLWEKK